MRTLYIALFILLNHLAFAQGNLQFNQVLFLTATTSNLAQWTVPVGKVWKIEALGGYAGSTYVYLNNQAAFEHTGPVVSSGGYYRHSASSPIWLPEGTILGHSSSTQGAYRWFSIIEFNIIP